MLLLDGPPPHFLTEQEVRGMKAERDSSLDWTPLLLLHESGCLKVNRFVLIATKEKVIPSLLLFVRCEPVPLISLATLTPPP